MKRHPPRNRQITLRDVAELLKVSVSTVSAALQKAGYTMADVVATNVQLDSVDDFAKMNGVYGNSFPKASPPTRTTRS